MNLTFRPAHPADAPLIVSILHSAFAEYQGKLDPPAGAADESPAHILEKMQEGTFILASLGDEPVGCVFYQCEQQHVYLGRLAVLPQYRKHGIARTLVEYIEQQALAHGLPRVLLGARTQIPYLQEYYTRLGYHILRYESHPGYAEPTYVIMEKELSNPIASE